MPGREAFVPAAWIYNRLATDEALVSMLGVTLATAHTRIGRDVLPLNTGSPYIIFNEVAEGNDVQGVGGIIIMTNPLWMVKAIVESTDDSSLWEIVGRMHTLLHRQISSHVMLPGLIGTRVACMRERTHYRAEGDDTGHPWREAGHVWRLFVEDH